MSISKGKVTCSRCSNSCSPGGPFSSSANRLRWLGVSWPVTSWSRLLASSDRITLKKWRAAVCRLGSEDHSSKHRDMVAKKGQTVRNIKRQNWSQRQILVIIYNHFQHLQVGLSICPSWQTEMQTHGGGLYICQHCLVQNAVLVSNYCSRLVEFVTVKCHPFYLQHKFLAVIILGVYISPNTNATNALAEIYSPIRKDYSLFPLTSTM